MTPDKPMTVSDPTRPIIGIENRTPLEVFDIMVDRIRHLSSPIAGERPKRRPSESSGQAYRENL